MFEPETETDRMIDDSNDGDGVSSTGGFSDNASLVGFGEGANSTISGPVSSGINRMTVASRQSSGMGASASATNRLSEYSAPASQHSGAGYSASAGAIPPSSPSAAGSNTPQPGGLGSVEDARMVDGMTFDENIIDTTARSPPPVIESGTSEPDTSKQPG